MAWLQVSFFMFALYFPEKIGEAAVNYEMQPQQTSLPRYVDS